MSLEGLGYQYGKGNPRSFNVTCHASLGGSAECTHMDGIRFQVVSVKPTTYNSVAL